MKPRERIKARKPVEAELKKLERRYGMEVVLSACNHFSIVARTKHTTQKKIRELEAQLAKLK